MEEETQTLYSWLDELLQIGRYGQLAQEHRRVDEATNPDGVLETLEEGTNEVAESGEAGHRPQQRRNPCQLKTGPLANCQQPCPPSGSF